MKAKLENLIVEHLHALRASLKRIGNEVEEVKHRLTSIESGIAEIRRDNTGMQKDVCGQQSAFDRIIERIDLIEKLLESRKD